MIRTPIPPRVPAECSAAAPLVRKLMNRCSELSKSWSVSLLMSDGDGPCRRRRRSSPMRPAPPPADDAGRVRCIPRRCRRSTEERDTGAGDAVRACYLRATDAARGRRATPVPPMQAVPRWRPVARRRERREGSWGTTKACGMDPDPCIAGGAAWIWGRGAVKGLADHDVCQAEHLI